MATYISTCADILESGYMTTKEKDRLTPHEWREEGQAAGPWHRWHVEAWNEIKRHLLSRPDAIEESDLSDSSELLPAAIQYVIYLAYSAAGSMDRAEHYLRGFSARMATIAPTLSGVLESAGTAIGYGHEITTYRG